MATHSVAEAKNKLSELIERARSGEGVIITRHGTPVAELRALKAAPRPIRPEALDELARFRASLGTSLPTLDAGEYVSRMRDDGER